jgi:hypothetical protein
MSYFGEGMIDSEFRIWIPSSAEWDHAWLTCQYATFFHGREWAEIWSEFQSEKYSPAPIAFEFRNGTRAVFPLTREVILKGVATSYVSSPAGTFGGWLAEKDLDEPEQSAIANYLQQEFSSVIWRFNPYTNIGSWVENKEVIVDFTHTLDLCLGFENIFKTWSKGHTSAVNKAKNAGVEIKLAETESDWDRYYEIYLDSIKRWGKEARSFYPRDFFKAIYKKNSLNIKLWLAWHDGAIIAGALCFYSPKHVVYWHGAALSSQFALRPVNLLMYEAIRNATELGYHWFDFNPSGGLEGVINFKKSFGAKIKSSNVYIFNSKQQKFFQTFMKICRYLNIRKKDANG